MFLSLLDRFARQLRFVLSHPTPSPCCQVFQGYCGEVSTYLAGRGSGRVIEAGEQNLDTVWIPFLTGFLASALFFLCSTFVTTPLKFSTYWIGPFAFGPELNNSALWVLSPFSMRVAFQMVLLLCEVLLHESASFRWKTFL